MHLSKIIKQKNGETVHMVMRRHPFVLIPAILIFLFTCFIGIGGYYFIATQFPNMIANDMGYAITIMIISILLLSAVTQMYGQFLDYYLDIWVVSNMRIINIEQTGLFGRTVAETDLYKVQDVTSNIEGFFPTTFNFGFVHIQSAGEISRFIFEQVHQPHLVRKAIMQLVQEDRKKHAAEAIITGV